MEGEGRATYDYGCVVNSVADEAGSVTIGFHDKDGNEETATADLVIAADGASSSVRSILLPQVQRRYAGYVAWRGTVPEREVSDGCQESLVEKFTFYQPPGMQILWSISSLLSCR